MNTKLVIGVVLMFSIFLISCTPQDIPPEKLCESDDECVAASCCHSTDAVNKDHRPDCSNVFCTMECKPGTLDCGQGEIRCIDNKCTAVLG